MPAGIEVYDESGNLIFDGSHGLSRVFGSVSVTGTDGDLENDAFLSCEPWFYILPSTAPSHYKYPDVSISGNTLTWTYGGDPNPANCVIVYGGF